MKAILLTMAAFLTLSAPIQAMPTNIAISQDEIAHGGGCRKSSPAGQCCHMDKKAGRVHCH